MTSLLRAAVAATLIAVLASPCAAQVVWQSTNNQPLPAYLPQDAVPVPGSLFNEYTAHSPVVRRRYVVGYEPAVTSSFMNPRVDPPGSWKWRTCQYTRMGLPPHFFGRLASELENTGAPLGSYALGYLEGETNVTGRLDRGYPYGQRVVEPVMVPYQGFGSPSGYFIYGGSVAVELGDPADRPATNCPTGVGPYGTGVVGVAAPGSVAQGK